MRILARLLPLALLLPLGSCVFIAGAAVGAGAIYSLGEDSVEQYFEASIAEAHAAALAEIRHRGEIRSEDPGSKEGRIEAEVEDSEVDVFFTAVTESTTRVVVRARKWQTLAPDLDLAQQLADRIALRLND
jgi:hypothetical protein